MTSAVMPPPAAGGVRDDQLDRPVGKLLGLGRRDRRRRSGCNAQRCEPSVELAHAGTPREFAEIDGGIATDRVWRVYKGKSRTGCSSNSRGRRHASSCVGEWLRRFRGAQRVTRSLTPEHDRRIDPVDQIPVE